MEDGVRSCYATDAERGCSSDSDCCNADATCSSGVCRLETTECAMNVYDSEAEAEAELELLDAIVQEDDETVAEATADALTVESHEFGMDAMAADSVCARSFPCAVA